MYHYKRYKIQQKKEPIKLLIFLAFLFMIFLSYTLIKWSNHHHKEYVTQALKLPTNESFELISENIPQNEIGPKVHSSWKTVQLKAGESLSVLFKRLNLSNNTLADILQHTKDKSVLNRIKPNQDIRVQIKSQQLVKMVLPIDSISYLVINKTKTGYTSDLQKKKLTEHLKFTTAVITNSLYVSAKQNNIPPRIIQQMSDIFSNQISFARDSRKGDYLSVAYKTYYIEDRLVSIGNIEAVSYNNKGKTYQAVRYVNTAGDAEYFTPQGQSFKKAFTRYPIRFSHISSNFSLSRYHPLLHYSRPHKGIDLAASIGTPIYATGNGKIVLIGRQNGYGNVIKIQHDSKYSTLYGHMLRFQKGLSKGSRVKRGDVIGFVGQSGLASGPHCHYEVHVAGIPRNPTTVDIPLASAIYGRELARFKRTTSPMMAKLNLYQKSQLANLHNGGKKASKG